MKTCSYCGRANDNSAEACVECRTGLGPDDTGRASLFTRLKTDRFILFRALVLLSLASFALGYFESYWAAPFFSAESRALLEWNTYDAILTPPRVVYAFQAGLYVFALGGLFQFLHSSRILFTWLLLAFGVEYLLTGMSVCTSVGAFVSYVGVLADGALLVMAYTAPVNSRFAAGQDLQPDKDKNSAENF